ncbi:uncharacterized protein LOC126657474 [Mercurialis annua]|uniref:uncharacterized protein LOC126657474 n=1 Tax=Mercurialis annua TaxID=3986 RepID=UPI00215F8CD2|nr:uncharacterized protein LOC126657474 [Mercurialis annua]
MGSLSPQQEQNHCIYASFCRRDTNYTSNWLECYDSSINAWHHVGKIPGLIHNHVLKDFSMVTIADSVYVIGGRLCRKLPAGGSVQDEVDVEVQSSVLCYNTRGNEWSKCASLGIPRFDFACTVSGDKIYVAGGKSELDCPRGISSAEVYDPTLDEWKPLPDMSTFRYKCVGVTWQGKIHVVGGFAWGGESNREAPWHTLERSSAEVYDSERDKWDVMLGMWKLDVPPNQIVAVNGTLFSSGDCLNAWKGHIELYDKKLNMWNEVDGSHLQTLSSPISTSDATEADWPPVRRLYLTMAPIGTHLYFLAGYRMPGEISRTSSAVHVFDTSANEYGWRSFEPMEEEGEKELCSHCCVVRQTL